MAYSALPTVNAGDTIATTTWGNVVKANIEYLLSSRATKYQRTSGDYTTTSTSATDVDSTNLSFTVTSAGTKIIIALSGIVSSNVNNGTVDFYVNIDGSDSPSVFTLSGMTASALYNAYFIYSPTVTVGAHTYKIRWKTSAATTMTLYGSTYYANVAVMEIA